jgi:hypothetical protein
MGMTKRERIEPNPGDSRYVRRDEEGRFTEDQVDVGASSAADQRRQSSTPSKPGQGDRGDRQDSASGVLALGHEAGEPEA